MVPADEEPISTTLAMIDYPSSSTQAKIENKTNEILIPEKGTCHIVHVSSYPYKICCLNSIGL
jgi:hypothetical protein